MVTTTVSPTEANRSLGASAGSWPTIISVLVVAAVVAIGLFWGAATSAVRVWYESSAYNHGFAILPIVGYLIWMRREALAVLPPKPFLGGLVPVGAASAIGVVGHVTQVDFVQQLGLVLLFSSIVLTVLGLRITRVLAFPLFFLLFAIPFGDSLVPWLQDITAEFVVRGLRLFGIPVFIDGVMISIPNGNFEVAEACSGLRFLTATLALGFLCMNLLFHTLWRRLVFLVLSLVVPIVANGVRAFGIVLLAYVSDNEIAVGIDHLIYGWIFFAFVTAILLAIAMMLRGSEPEPAEVPRAPGGAGPTIASPRAMAVAGLAAVLVSVVFPAMVAARQDSAAVDVAAVPAPQVGPPWQLASAALPTWTPSFPMADLTDANAYLAGDTRVDHFIAFYARQRADAEVVGFRNRLTDNVEWKRLGGSAIEVEIDGRPLTVNMVRITSRGQRRVAVYWYWVDGAFTASKHVAKLRQAKVAILGGTQAAAAIFVSAAYDEQPDEAIRAIQGFLAGLEPLGPQLRQASLR